MPFVPILVTMCLALRMDAVVAVGIIYVGAGVGYGCAALNPFTVLIAQDIAGLELTSGQGFRWLLLLLCVFVGVDHILRYVRRIRTDSRASLVADIDYSSGFEVPGDVRFTPRRIAVVALCAGAVVVFVYGVAAWAWYLTELAAVFLALALVAAVVARLAPGVVAGEFCRGAAELTKTALLIGFARTIQVVLSDGRVIDTVIDALAQPLQALPRAVAAVGMLGVQTACNFFIPSGSGQAYVTMPIMAPLADLTEISRQTAVLAYQLWRRLHEYGRSNQCAPHGHLGAGPHSLPALAAVRRSAPPQALRGGGPGSGRRGLYGGTDFNGLRPSAKP